MRIELCRAASLGPELIAVWEQLQRDHADLASPFFAPGFALAVERTRGGIEVGVLYERGEPVGFFPFERRRFGEAAPPALGFNEFHGVVARPDLRWNMLELLRSCRLNAWRYDHLPLAQADQVGGCRRVSGAPFADLSQGFDAWCASRREARSEVVSQAERKRRKLAREVGDVRLVRHEPDPAALGKLLTWKSDQHRRTKVVDVFQRPWVVRLLEAVRDSSSDGCRGRLSVLMAGRTPVAVHLGMVSRTVAHLWYPAFDRDFARYSPGIILLVDLLRDLASEGVRRLDFGPGGQPYKARFASGEIPVALGVADRIPTARRLRRASWVARDYVRRFRPASSR